MHLGCFFVSRLYVKLVKIMVQSIESEHVTLPALRGKHIPEKHTNEQTSVLCVISLKFLGFRARTELSRPNIFNVKLVWKTTVEDFEKSMTSRQNYNEMCAAIQLNMYSQAVSCISMYLSCIFQLAKSFWLC